MRVSPLSLTGRVLTTRRTVDGRVWFTVPSLFETSICLRGGNQDDGWFFVHVEFLFTVGGDRTGMQGLYSYYLSYVFHLSHIKSFRENPLAP